MHSDIQLEKMFWNIKIFRYVSLVPKAIMLLLNDLDKKHLYATSDVTATAWLHGQSNYSD